MVLSQKLNELFKYYEQYGFHLEFIKNLKSGKEANVVLLKNASDSNFYILKIYKDFETRGFIKRSEYLEGMYIRRPSLRHAVEKGTTLGKTYLESRWINSEIHLLKKLNEKSDNIPKIYASAESSILMEFIGDIKSIEPSPRLSDIKLTIKEAKNILIQIINFMIDITDLGYVHADLSPFNILIKKDKTRLKAYIIDFPQAVNIITNKNAPKKFEHDLEMIKKYFKREYDIDNEEFFDNLINKFETKLSRG